MVPLNGAQDPIAGDTIPDNEVLYAYVTSPDGELIDSLAGQADLRAGLVRVLHERSFQDDATRMLRAARYAARRPVHLRPG